MENFNLPLQHLNLNTSKIPSTSKINTINETPIEDHNFKNKHLQEQFQNITLQKITNHGYSKLKDYYSRPFFLNMQYEERNQLTQA